MMCRSDMRVRVCRDCVESVVRVALTVAPQDPAICPCRTATPACLVWGAQQHKPGACSRRQHKLSLHRSLISALKCLLHCSPLRSVPARPLAPLCPWQGLGQFPV